MVDTTDSKSVASNRVRVQVSSPVSEASRYVKPFVFNAVFTIPVEGTNRVCGTLWLPACGQM